MRHNHTCVIPIAMLSSTWENVRKHRRKGRRKNALLKLCSCMRGEISDEVDEEKKPWNNDSKALDATADISAGQSASQSANQSEASIMAPPEASAPPHKPPPLGVTTEEPEPAQDIEMPPAMEIQDHNFASQEPPAQDDLHSKLASTLTLNPPGAGGDVTAGTLDLNGIETLVKNRMDPQSSTELTTPQDEMTDEDTKAKYLHRRHFVVQELVETERDYVQDLGCVVEGYMAYMNENPMPEGFEGKDKIAFGNIHQIYDWHRETFLSEIEKCADEPDRVGTIFTRYERRLHMYVKYCENKPKSEYIVAEYVDTYFEEIRQKLGHRLQLPDLLIKPVQRIMKYQLLLRDILKHTEKAGLDVTTLQKAVTVMCVVPKAANDMMNVGRLQGFDGKITAQGKLLLQETLLVSEMSAGPQQAKFKERRVFLFEQIILFSDMVEKKKGNLSNPEYIYKNCLKVNKMAMQPSPDGDPMKFILIDRTPGADMKLLIQAPNEETKNTWIEHVQSILDMQGDFLKALQAPIAYMNKMKVQGTGSPIPKQKELVKEMSAPEMNKLTKNSGLRKTQSQPQSTKHGTKHKTDTHVKSSQGKSGHLSSADSSLEEDAGKSSNPTSPIEGATGLDSRSLGSNSDSSPKPKKNSSIFEGFKNPLRKSKLDTSAASPGSYANLDNNSTRTNSDVPAKMSSSDTDIGGTCAAAERLGNGKALCDYNAVREDEISVTKGEILQIIATNQNGRILVHRPVNDHSPAAEGWLPGFVVVQKDGARKSSGTKLRLPRWRTPKDVDGTRSLERHGKRWNQSQNWSGDASDFPPAVHQPLSDITVHAGETALFTCMVCGRPKPNVAWKSPDHIYITPGPRTVFTYTEEGIATLQISNIRMEDSGEYFCVVLNDLGATVTSARLFVLDEPQSPGKPVIRSQTGTSVHLEWLPPPQSASYQIQGYTVEILEKGSDTWQAAVAYVPSCSQVITDLTVGATYIFRVSANNAVGMSAPSLPSDPVSIATYNDLSDRDERSQAVWKATFANDYTEYAEMGRGRFAVVRKCIQNCSGREVAAKCISRKVLSQDAVETEYNTLQSLQHVHLLRMFDLYQTPQCYVLIMEILHGGRLFDYICTKPHYDEVQVSMYIYQLLDVTQYLHNCRVAHLDIKPENVLVDIGGISPTLKLVDFGDARHIYNNYYVHQLIGSPEFASPELVKGAPVTLATDIWSIGVVTYVLLSGVSPFLDESLEETCSNIVRHDYCFPEEYFKSISTEAQHFISLLLEEDMSKRPTAQVCLDHEWIKKFLGTPSPIQSPLHVVAIPTSRLYDFIQRRRHQNDSCTVNLSEMSDSVRS